MIKNQLEYLKLISGFHALTLKTIATKLKKSESTARGTLNILIKGGYLKSERIPPGKYGTQMYWVTQKTRNILNN